MKRPKLRKCPECGRQHTGFTEVCGDCAYAQLIEHEKQSGEPLPEGAIVTVDAMDSEAVTKFLTGEPKNVTPVTKRGRPRKHKDDAARQKAWRGR